MRSVLIPIIAAAILPATASAQSNVEGRVGKLESEMRAVQRKVFPGGAGQYLQPEVTAPATTAGPGPGTPASSAVVDLTQRVASLESQMSTMTGQIEQNQFKLRQLQEAFDAYQRATDARLKAAEAAPAPAAPLPAATVPAPAFDGDAPGNAAPSRPLPRPAADKPVAATKPAAADSPRAALVDAVQKPTSGDTPEDEYLYGYRLWAAKLYPEAAAQLKKVVADYPKHRRASYAQNLLGRSYLDDGKPSLASMAFYDNYKRMPDGERAPESLYNLAQALMKLKKPADACKVYGELTDVYGAKVSATMKADIARGRTAAKCE